jgi:2,3-bisphosphoglycerate-dependent phosphoglycerate mutase
LPQLLEGQNILLVSHGNGIRSLVKYLESISDQDIEQVEMIFNTLLVYSVDEKGKMVKKEVFSVDNET